MADTMVRMGELAVSRDEGDRLVALGLGSCIGLVLLDRRRGIAGLAHVVLPDSNGMTGEPAKFADRVLPFMLERVTALGALRPRLEAVIAGGAKMFALGGSGADIGARNDAAVRKALKEASIPITAHATGGTRGRTLRVSLDGLRVTVKEAGAGEVVLAGNEALAGARA